MKLNDCPVLLLGTNIPVSHKKCFIEIYFNVVYLLVLYQNMF